MFLVSSVVWGQDDKKKEEADKLFEKEQYVDATQLYLQLLTNDPKNVDVNFKYGTCLLYNSDKKQDALRYLKFAASSEGADARSFYFLGKAYHLNYQFDDAKKNYQIYQKKIPKEDDRYPVKRNIEMCDNGKKLLSTFTDIIVSEKKEIDQEKFFRLYHDMQSIGGQILVTERFQSKLDKKKGHVPIVHFPQNAKAVYYSSYGDDDKNGLDIFVRRKLPNGEWGEEQRLPGDVNTPYDDDFPYMHPSGNFLYFSSKGHNSMGGYDVFLARRNADNNRFERVENVDFAISSPDDDLFYVVDSLYQNAYFASSRQSRDGKMHVYRVKVARVPIQQVIVMGDFLSEINPENKAMNISVVAMSNNQEVGKIKSDPKGQYSFFFPKGGKYKYVIDIEGSNITTEVALELPFLDEFRMLKQRVVHTTENGNEVVKVVNLFDEKVEGGSELLASVIRRKADLDVNIDDFDPEALAAFELSAKRAEILEDLGYKGMSSLEVMNQLDELASKEEMINERVDRMTGFLDLKTVENGDRLEELVENYQELISKAESANSDAEKYTYLTEAKKIEDQINKLTSEIAAIESINEETNQLNSAQSGSISDVRDQFKEQLEAGNEENALDLLAASSATVTAAKSRSVDELESSRIDESIKMNEDANRLKKKLIEYEREITRLEAEIQALDSKLPNARKKEAEEIKSELQQKRSELDLYEEEKLRTQQDIQKINQNVAELNDAVNLLQEANKFSGTLDEVNQQAISEAVETSHEAKKLVEQSAISDQIASIETANPTISENLTSVENLEVQENIKKKTDQTELEILANSSLSEEEKLEALIENNVSAMEEIDNSMQDLENQLNADPENESLLQEQMELLELKSEIAEQTKDYQAELGELRNEPVDVALTKEDVIASVDPTYQTELKALENQSLTPVESLEARQNIDQKLVESIDKRIQEIERELAVGNNSELVAEKEMLSEIQSEKEAKIEKRSSEIAELKSKETLPKTSEELIANAMSTYSDDVAEIENAANLSEVEIQEKLQKVDNTLISKLETKQQELANSISADPNNESLIKQKELVDETLLVLGSQIEERAQTINALNNSTSVSDTDMAAIESSVQSEMESKFRRDREKIDAVDDPFEQSKQMWELEQEVMDYLVEEKTSVEKELVGDSENSELIAKKKVIESMISQQNSVLTDQKALALEEAQKKDQLAEILSEVDRNYEKEIALAKESGPAEVVNREVELQEKVEEQITKNESTLERKYSVSVDLENMLLREVLSESKTRVEENQNALANENSDQKKNVFVGELRQELFEGSENDLTADYTTKTELENQEKVLVDYQSKLEKRLGEIQEQRQIDATDPQLIAEESYVEEELTEVKKKLGRVRITLGDLETEVIASSNSDEQLISLENEENELSASLQNENLSSSERKELEERLSDVQNQKLTRENEISESNVRSTQAENSELADVISNGQNETSSTANDLVQKNNESSYETLKAVEKAKSEEEKAYLLENLADNQARTNEVLKEIAESQRIEEIESSQGITIQSKEELESTKRKYSIRIGALETELERVNDQISEAKKKELPALELRKDQLEAEIKLLTQRVNQIDQQLTEVEESEPLISEVARNTEVSYNEERKIASTEEYKSYLEIIQDAIKLENQINELKAQLDQERADLRKEIKSDPLNLPSDLELRTQRITKLDNEILGLELERNRIKQQAEQSLPSNNTEAMKIQNLVARGVQPIKTTLVATAILSMPTNGFSLDAEGTNIYSEENPIPVGVESPSGLVYRVQVGAFAKPIPQDLFNEFNPVSGEKISNTNITRYMAGYFNSSESVTDARQKIRDLGYSDAFVVAYCNGERITFGEARRLEAAGVCVPKRAEEIMIEVAEKTADNLGIETTVEVEDLPDWSYHDAPGAVKAKPMEATKGLFFTVQIGVFNRPVSPEEVQNLPEIMTYRLSNGQIRYATGMFDSVEDALPRRTEALERGMEGSFVTAYYEGERISITKARELLASNGPEILESNRKTEPEKPIETPDNVVRTDSVSANTVEIPVKIEPTKRPRVQVVTKKQFDDYPRDVLNRYNTEGNFYYDVNDRRVKSIIYENEDRLPRLSNFKKDIDTIFISEADYQLSLDKKVIQVRVADSVVPGDFMDWLIRLAYLKEISLDREGTLITIRGIEPNKVVEVQNNIRIFNLVPEIKDEIELEGIEEK